METEKTQQAQETQRQPYELNTETLMKLGIDENYNEIQDSPKESTSEKTDAENGDDDNKTPDVTSEKETDDKGTKTESSQSEESPEKERSSSDEDEGGDFSFADKVIERIEKFDEEAQGQFLKDLEDWDKFTASNRQRSQDLADQKRELENLVEKFGSDKLQTALKELMDSNDIEDFLDSADEWYEGKDKNKIRNLVELLSASTPEIGKYKTEYDALAEERADFAVKKEIDALYDLKGGDAYKDIDTLQELGKLADQHGVDLATAHKIRMSDIFPSQIAEKDTEISTLKKELRKIKAELKERNKKLTEKIKTESLETEVNSGISGKGVSGVDYLNKSSGFDETEARLQEQFGI